MTQPDVIEQGKIYLASRADNEDGPTRLLRIVVAKADSTRGPMREEIVNGCCSFFIASPWLVKQLDCTTEELNEWAGALNAERLCQFEIRGHGLTIWMRCRFTRTGEHA